MLKIEGFKPCVPHLVQNLERDDLDKLVEFCEAMVEMANDDEV